MYAKMSLDILITSIFKHKVCQFEYPLQITSVVKLVLLSLQEISTIFL